ncbi:Aste57867_2683 [Aphanomyces stellatus]|uniref:non-specific serine/threonine protein kinase n=1 Tax=Aphanomyces stellatus TaxID=120398 RepID=A0A485K836_9STRA|nr:hypothetical protein As57867_002676 [Aphanomyces stellatus]VFT79877.1 Aste57867_2683 [Aphanomyces stellatus]
MEWTPYIDEYGQTYYQHNETGETAWEIPSAPSPREAVVKAVHIMDEGDATWTFGGVNPDGTFYFVNSKTGECVRHLPTDASDVATRQDSMAADDDSGLTVLDAGIDADVAACMAQLIASIETDLKEWARRRQRNAKALTKQKQQQQQKQSNSTKKKRMGEMIVQAKRYEHTDAFKARRAKMEAQLHEDEVVKEVVRVKDRFKLRREHQVKQALAWNRASVKDEEIRLRHHVTRVLIAKATNGLDIHGKIDLSSEDPATTHVTKRESLYESEERVAANAHRTQQLEALFVSLDECKLGSLSALHTFHRLTTQPDIQRFVHARKGLKDLVMLGVLQAFFFELGQINLTRFITFVHVTEDVVMQVDRIRAAIEQAGLGIVSADLASWQGSMMNVKSGETVPRKLVAINRLVQSFQTQKETATSQLRHVLHFRATFAAGNEHPPIWQLAHKHVYIQLQPTLPVYCVHCRRNRWRLKKLERYEAEGAHRAMWGRELARRMLDAEVDLRHWDATSEPPDIASIPWTTYAAHENHTVAGVVRDLVAATELLGNYAAWEARILAPPPPPPPPLAHHHPVDHHHHGPTATSPSHTKAHLLTRLTELRAAIEMEELARTLLFEEDEWSREIVEATKVAIEVPLIQAQDAAHKEFVRLLQACLEPSIYLKRLNFERMLAIRSDTDEMVLRMVDSASNTRCVLHTIRCTSEAHAAAVVAFARTLEQLQPPHVLRVLHVFSYTYQQFSCIGNLNECWPIVFVAVEDCARGAWLPRPPFGSVPPADILHILCTTSAALASLHSHRLCHFNVNPTNLYRSDDDALKLGGFLAFKRPFTDTDRATSIEHLVHPAIAPPAAVAMDEKTDMWALGCLLYVLLTGSMHVVVKDKPLAALMNDIPLRYGPSLRSCVRMLLQPNPRHRPTAADLFNFVSCASPEEEPLVPNLKLKKKSVPALEPLAR